MTKMFSAKELAAALEAFNEGDESPVFEAKDRKVMTMSLIDSDLYVECEMVFRDGDDVYRAIYHRMSDYYMSRVGEECYPFEAYKGDKIPCTQVFPHASTVYTDTP